ncbi:unnamed protein product [Psylliodes chrysocephalus]|uniref:HAT C-terminal dimerisation domain-containing protein n=1 Tax=Psylliodes chrysocephalus TaxID=3402493 RepID=A0A9P0C9E6_9CUCU|nr:unnamed protein product [Psylliodes chrysocephala]
MFTLTNKILLKSSKHLNSLLTDDSRNEFDIDASDLYEEIKTLKIYFESTSTSEGSQQYPKFILEFIFQSQLLSTFPNISIALKLLLTLPVSVASGEISFSKLKIIKNYLRSTMLQDRLNDLSIIAIENDIMDSLYLEELIKDFSAKKARKTIFL